MGLCDRLPAAALGGKQQRIAAGALADHQACVLLLDERFRRSIRSFAYASRGS